MATEMVENVTRKLNFRQSFGKPLCFADKMNLFWISDNLTQNEQGTFMMYISGGDLSLFTD